MQLYQWTVVVALLLLALEITLPSFFFAGLAFGAGCVALVHFIMDDFDMVRDLVIFAVSSVAGFVALRAIFRHGVKNKSDISRY